MYTKARWKLPYIYKELLIICPGQVKQKYLKVQELTLESVEKLKYKNYLCICKVLRVEAQPILGLGHLLTRLLYLGKTCPSKLTTALSNSWIIICSIGDRQDFSNHWQRLSTYRHSEVPLFWVSFFWVSPWCLIYGRSVLSAPLMSGLAMWLFLTNIMWGEALKTFCRWHDTAYRDPKDSTKNY